MTEPTGPRSLSDYAERALLGVLAHDPRRVAELGPEFTQRYFGDGRNAALFRALRTDLAPQASRLRQQHADVAGTPQWAQILLDAAPGLRETGVDAGYLTAVLALAPPGSGQPEVYSHLIVEASIRRELTAAGLQVGQASAATPALTDMLAVIDTAFDQVSAAQHRWEQITDTRSLTRALNTDPGSTPVTAEPLPVHIRQPAPPPSEADLLAAQESVVGGVLRFPEFAGQVLGRLEPADFTDPELTTAIRAAAEVHAEAATTGWHVDPVTVAWAQQRQAAEHGAGAPPHRLHALTATAEPAQLDTALDLVMRSSLARMSAHAAEQAQQLAQRADLTPEQLLADTRDTYAAVQTAAVRMTGPAGTAHQLAVHAHRSTTAQVDFAPTTGNLTALRDRTAGLLDLLDPPADNAHPNPGSTLSARLDLDHTAETTLDEEVTPDAGPEL